MSVLFTAYAAVLVTQVYPLNIATAEKPFTLGLLLNYWITTLLL